ncbi:MAG: isochorismate pyruvate lyase [Sulfurimonas sp.]|jgi:isochorismate pyruvate lyase|uniref:chorismate mutase n=1 Tax=Sulfurimonas sp. TaxID=2022749 RepID=UPI0025D13561|nr:chorismate mutase [Sulfurimonas sp.]
MVECNSLEEVRTEIDKLDTKLVELISQRSRFVRKAASFKDTIDDVKADDRIEYIMQTVRHKAIELNLSPNMISELFTIMIDEMVELEISEFSNTETF